MKAFVGYILDFHKGYFSFKLYLSLALFVALLIAFNYTVDLEDSYIDAYAGKPVRALWFFLLHGCAYFGALAIIQWQGKVKSNLTREFWILSLIGFAVLSIDRSLTFHTYYVWNNAPTEIRLMLFKSVSNFFTFFSLLIPLYLLKRFTDERKEIGFYGLTLKNIKFKPYWTMLAIMVPLVVAASFTEGFQSYYPTYKRAGGESFANYFQLPEFFSAIFFELFYLSGFVYVELFFRGFLVIGFVRILGKNAVIPMAITYATYHFGKPIGETISSVFGGYLLGIIALYSKNIWGGVFVHMGIAFLMELFAFLAMAGFIGVMF